MELPTEWFGDEPGSLTDSEVRLYARGNSTKIHFRGPTAKNAPRIRPGVTKKVQKAELKTNQTRGR